MTVARHSAAGLALLLAVCGSSGDGAEPGSGWVIHLDPRLADGRSPTAALAEGEVVVAREFVIRSPAANRCCKWPRRGPRQSGTWALPLR